MKPRQRVIKKKVCRQRKGNVKNKKKIKMVKQQKVTQKEERKKEEEKEADEVEGIKKKSKGTACISQRHEEGRLRRDERGT
jgi:hypothetical protein